MVCLSLWIRSIQMLQIYAGRWCQLKCQNNVWKHFEKSHCKFQTWWCFEKERLYEGHNEKRVVETFKRLGNLAWKCRNYISSHLFKYFVWRTSSWFQKRNQNPCKKIIILSPIKDQWVKLKGRSENCPTQTRESN